MAARGAAMKSISIMWAEGVTEEEAVTVVETIKGLVKTIYDVCFKAGVGLSPTEIRPFGTWIRPAVPRTDPYSGTHWYVDTAYDRGLGQVVASRFLELVRREPWQTQRPHFDVAVLDCDLTDTPHQLGRQPPPGFVLASALPGTATVISVHRLREIADPEARHAALRRLVVHNFGHVLEIPVVGRAGVDASSLAERHCPNVCAMRHAGQVDELMRLGGEERELGSVGLCDACRADLLKSVLVQRFSQN